MPGFRITPLVSPRKKVVTTSHTMTTLNMDPAPNSKGARSQSYAWSESNNYSRATPKTGRYRLKTPKPVISAPMGPVQNSRGPDLTRSNNFVIVDGIKDCVSPVNNKRGNVSNVPAGYIKETLPSKPTVAESSITATTSVQVPRNMRSANQLRLASMRDSPKPPRPCLKTSSTLTLLPRIESPPQDENIPPSNAQSKPKAPSPSKIPKSRTMNILHDLKTSISRSSLNARGPIRIEDQASSASSRSTIVPSTSSKLRLPDTSQTSLCQSPRSCTPEPDPFLVDDAQPSAYWSGRFMSLWDKFSSECLRPVPHGCSGGDGQQESKGSYSTSKRTKTTILPRPAHLPRSTTTSALVTVEGDSPKLPQVCSSEETTRRIFRHLESFCATEEARMSFREWQRAYAQRHQQPSVLPQAQAVVEKGTMSRWLTEAQRNSRRSFSALREAATATRAATKREVSHRGTRQIPRARAM